jgi:pimeloyl-ACP methyl ester carboxylesterase
MTASRTTRQDVRLTEQGSGPAVLLLHGGGGPQTVAAFADVLADRRVYTPTHPGYAGTARPEALRTPADLARLYVDLLDELDLTDVTVVGNSIGGWIAAEMALLESAAGASVSSPAVSARRRIGAIVLVDAVGIEVPGHPVADFFALSFPEIAQLSYHDPEAFRIDPAALPPEAQAQLAANRATLAVYAAQGMTDPGLLARLGGIDVPALVVWGDSDGIAGPAYGRAFAAAVPGARFELLTNTGHLPQLESPQQLAAAVRAFSGVSSTAGCS